MELWREVRQDDSKYYKLDQTALQKREKMETDSKETWTQSTEYYSGLQSRPTEYYSGLQWQIKSDNTLPNDHNNFTTQSSQQPAPTVASTTQPHRQKVTQLNLEYIRKNIYKKFSCTRPEQILGFYQQLIYNCSSGGIHMIELYDIKRKEGVHKKIYGMTPQDYAHQSQTLYNLLSSEKTFPTDFNLARNYLT